MTSRPSFVTALLDRPLPELHPPKLTEKSNPPWSAEIAMQIANALFHPKIESILHLMNDDLFSAHFLVRKMQQDQMGKWLHGILHLKEGDYANAKCWYRDMSLDLQSTFFKGGKREAYAYLDRVARASGKSIEDCRKTSKKAEILDQTDPPPDEVDELEVRKTMWAECVCVLEQLEKEYGWKRDVEGSTAYTQDQGDISEKKSGMLLGEGVSWSSRFTKAGTHFEQHRVF